MTTLFWIITTVIGLAVSGHLHKILTLPAEDSDNHVALLILLISVQVAILVIWFIGWLITGAPDAR